MSAISRDPAIVLFLNTASILRLFKAGGGRVINVSDFKHRYKELKMLLIDNPEQTNIPSHLKSSNIPLVRINYLHSLVLEVRNRFTL